MNAPLVEFRNATIYRGRTRVFDGLNLSIERTERVAILGPNGSGKSTLVKAINREIYPLRKTDSHCRILGRERWNVLALRRRLGVFSAELLNRYPLKHTATDVVLSGFFASVGVHGTLAARVSNAERTAARHALERVGLGAHVATPLERLSDGQRRRCLLARALVHEPPALLLDEPTAGLDFAAAFDLLRRIDRLEIESLVLVTHALGDISPAIDRVLLLANGRIAADGPPADILTGPVLTRVYGVGIGVHVAGERRFAYADGEPEIS